MLETVEPRVRLLSKETHTMKGQVLESLLDLQGEVQDLSHKLHRITMAVDIVRVAESAESNAACKEVLAMVLPSSRATLKSEQESDGSSSLKLDR